MALRIKAEDEVIVISGKDKGKTGKVLRVDAANDRVLVEGLNIIKRHQRAMPGSMQPAGVIEREASIHVSNVALIDPKTNKPTRSGVEVRDGNRVRVSKRSGEVI
jgi:large subunit ribosomal protein L24